MSSNLVIIIGESGMGKSSSIRSLDDSETFLINPLRKRLPFRCANYCAEEKNYMETESYNEIIAGIRIVNEDRAHVTSIVIDDFSFLMNIEFMNKCLETGFQKFTNMAKNVFDLMQACRGLREDLDVFLMCHTEQDHAGVLKPKTVGKMTADYVGIAERSAVVLHSRVVDEQYCFQTQHNGIHMAKTPMGMFDKLQIENDLKYVKEKMKTYYQQGG